MQLSHAILVLEFWRLVYRGVDAHAFTHNTFYTVTDIQECFDIENSFFLPSLPLSPPSLEHVRCVHSNMYENHDYKIWIIHIPDAMCKCYFFTINLTISKFLYVQKSIKQLKYCENYRCEILSWNCFVRSHNGNISNWLISLCVKHINKRYLCIRCMDI